MTVTDSPIRVLIVHNLLWSHYKAALFDALHDAARQSGRIGIFVAQLARTERSRMGMTDPTGGEYTYPHDLLFDGSLEDFSAISRFRSILRVIRRYRPHVVNLTGYYDPAQLGILAYCKLRGVRTVLSTESGESDHARRGWMERLKRCIIRQFDGYFCFGSTSAAYLRSLGAQPEAILTQRAAVVDDERIRQVYETTRTRFSRADRGLAPKNFIYVGRLIAEKNLNRLLAAFEEARSTMKNGSEWGLILLGEGAQKSALQRQVLGSALSNVYFLPGVPWYEVPAALALADVLVLPSYSEPWGLVVNEAMVCGLPVLVSERCGCVPDLVVPGETGFLFDPYDVTQLSIRLVALADASPEDRLRLGEAGRQRVEGFSLPRVAGEMLKGFERLAVV